MMRKKISWLFLLTVFLTLFSCRNEQDILNEASANRNRDIISFSVFQKETQIQKVGEVISPLSTAQKNNQNDDPLSGFLIDTETINRIKANGDISTYAFRIYSLFGNPQDVYNMVYRKRNDGTLHYSIIRIKGNTPYVLYDSEAASIAQKHAAKNSTAKTSSHEDCAASYSVSIWHCKNGHSWETCDKCPECLETLTVCVGSGGGDNSGGFGNPSDGNPSDPPPPLDPFLEGGSAAYLTDPSGYVFDPNIPPSTDKEYVRALRARLFWEQIPGALYRQWASGNAGIYHNLIENYLNNYSTDDNSNNINFTNWAIDFLMQNPQYNSYFSIYPNDIEKINLHGTDYANADQAVMANKLAPIFTELIIAERNNTINQINVQDPIWKAAKDYMIYLIKSNAPKAVEYGRIIYKHANKYFKSNPDSLQKVNDFIEFMKAGVLAEVPIITNPHYMKWTDVLVCWLLEIGDFPVNDSAGYGNLPTIGFAGADYTISGDPSGIIPMRYLSAHKMKNGAPDPNSVLGIRETAIKNIKIGNLTSVQGNWVFGSDATVDTITKLDGMQFCIGSYQPIVYITPLGNNQYKLTFVVKNKTGWQSGTRGLNDYNGNPTDDSILGDQPRGTGVHLGGTIAETFGWYEIITVN